MNLSEIKRSAREQLDGKWGKGALLTLCCLGITLLIYIALLFLPSLIYFIISILISAPIIFGINVSFIKLKREKNVSYVSFFKDSLNNFAKIWFVKLKVLLKLLPFIILLVACIGYMIYSVYEFSINGSLLFFAALGKFLSTILITSLLMLLIYLAMLPKYLLYSLTNFILYDNPNKADIQIVEESEKIMKGNRLKFIGLQFSFIGWIILSSFTFGIGYFFLIPYMKVSTIVFYESLIQNVDFVSSNDTINYDEYEIIRENQQPIIDEE